MSDESQVNESEVKTLMIDVPYDETTVSKLKETPLIRDNFGSLKSDFEKVYKAVLNQSLPIPDFHMSKIKSDLLAAFCRGAVVATDISSAFRQGFNLPSEILEQIGTKSKIILPDQEIKGPPKKIIV